MTLDFYIYNLHEITVWEETCKALRQQHVDARLVLEPPGTHTAMGSRPDPANGFHDSKAGDLVPLMNDEAHAEALAWLQHRGLTALDRGRYRADAVVTTQGIGWLWRYRGVKLKTAYGCAANRNVYGHSEMNRGLDGVFVQGEYSRECISRWVAPEDVVVTGYPRFDRFFRGEIDRTAYTQRFQLELLRPTVVYLSTWAHNSSLARFAEAIAALGRTYNVLYKPHHNNLHFEPERIAALRSLPGVRVETEERDIVPFLAVADLVLADVRSGSLTEAMLAGRRAIGLSAHGDRAEDNLVEDAAEAAPICDDPAALPAIVAGMLERDAYAAGRRRLVARLFTTTRGRDAEVTATEMKALVRRKKLALAGAAAG